MKKLMMAVAIVCAAVAAQGASISWSNSATSKITDLTGADMSNTYYTSLIVSLVDSKGTTVSSMTAIGMTAGVLTGSGMTYTYKYIEDGVGDYENGDTFTILAKMTVDGTDYEMTVGSFAIAATDNTGKDTFTWASGNYGGLADTPTVGKWSAAAAVPEPTSGLLLALGLCGLALKRKRA